MSNYDIYNGDAYKTIEILRENNIVVDHIITDPPYNISQDNNFNTMRNPRAGVDFGEWDRGGFDLYSWIPMYADILDKNGSMIIFCSYRFISYIIDVLESAETGMVVKDILVWKKSNPMPRNIERRYVQDMEFAVWAVKKNAKWIFNKGEDVPYRRALFTTSTVNGAERLGHPTQKSFKLMQDIIKIHTNEGQLIMDPFMGSGSTGAAALSMGRRFIGNELNEEYFQMAQKRLEQIRVE